MRLSLLLPALFATVALLPAQAPRAGAAGPRASLPLAPSAVTADGELVVDAPTAEVTWAVGRGYKARVAADGLDFRALPGRTESTRPVHLQLASVTVGGTALPLQHTKRPDGGTVCVLDHGSLVQQLALRPEGVEQSFHFATLPQRGELVVRVAVATDLAAAPRDGGVQFGTGVHAVHYGRALAFDAAGRRVAMPSRWIDGALQVNVPAAFVAAATLPLVVDPLLAPVLPVDTGPSTGINGAVGEPDVSYDPATDSYLVVWQQYVSSLDRDVYCRRYSANWTALGAAQAVDVTTADWQLPRVAHRARNNEWLVVAYVQTYGAGASWSVAARRIPASGAAPAALTVATAPGVPPVVGPVVGGDPYAGGGFVASLVAWPSGTDLRYTTIDQNHAIAAVQTFPTIGTILELEISRSNGSTQWLLGWASGVFTPTSYSASYQALRVDFSGAPQPFGAPAVINLGGSPGFGFSAPTALAISSPDLQGRYTVTTRDLIQSRLLTVSNGGVVGGSMPMSVLAAGWPTTRVAVETDGVRVLALRATATGVTGLLLAYTGGASPWRVDETVDVTTTVPVQRVQLTSAFAEGQTSTVSPFAIAYAESGSVSTGIRLAGWRGHQSGAGFTWFATACGTPPTITPTGVPALGNTVSFALGTSFPIAGFVFGVPVAVPLTGICACTLGADGQILVGNTLSLSIPPNVALVGQTFSAQGFTFQAGPCFGSVSLTATVDMHIL